jgi:hypothetical protein
MSSDQQVRRVPAPPDPGRVETGAVQFGNDWPGLFIRGDDAFYLMITLRRLKELLGDDLRGEAGFRLAELMEYADIVEQDVVVRATATE